ncbi:MAG: alpha/beta fold hydrolase [Bacteroidales bacterium]|nr:alpha/beta fold hydrolase [Bacteroidales bacterium]
MKKTANNFFRRFFSLLLIIMLILSSCGEKTKKKNYDIEGNWLGELSIQGMPLKIAFNFKAEGDTYVVTLDSPDQGAFDIATSSFSLSNNKIEVEADIVDGKFKGTIISNSYIKGTWTQNGSSFPLKLKKQSTPYKLVRPQEPIPPYPYEEELVTFHNDSFNIDLSGTLTVPLGDRVYKTAIMITGSGAENRDEEIYGHKPFKVIADYLTRNGIAVLRFDDRGTGESQGDYNSATSADLATDVEAALNFLVEHPKIDTEYIGLIGHSEGGLIAPIVASRNPNISFIVSLAGPAVTGKEISLRQSHDLRVLLGMKEKKVQKSSAINEMIYDEIIKEPDPYKASENIENMLRSYLKKRLILKKLVDIQLKSMMSQLTPETLIWYRYFLMTDPSDFWRQTKCPVLAFNGEKDIQVAAEVNLPALEKALKESGNENYEIHLMPNLNHLFQHCETGNVSEYATIEETFSEEVLEIMVEWINSLGDE